MKWIIFALLQIIELTAIAFLPYWVGAFIDGESSHFLLSWMTGFWVIVVTTTILFVTIPPFIKFNIKLSKKICEVIK